jgi:hypothetical protein
MTRNCRLRPNQRLRTLLRSSAVRAAVAACLVAGCGVLTLEEQLLQRFFEASRLYDMAALAKVALPGVVFNPALAGIVDGFTVTNVLHEGERRTVSVDAQVRTPSGTRAQKLTVVIEQTGGDWLITDVMQLPASRTSRGASSAPPY